MAAELKALAKAREDYKGFLLAPADRPLGAFRRFLESFDIGTIQPLVMVILERHTPETELVQMLEYLESYLLRRTVCGLPTKAYNRLFLALASNIQKDGGSAAKLRQRLSDLTGGSSVWPSDEAFNDAFVNRASYHSLIQSRLLHILKRLNLSFYTSRSEKITIQSDLWIEHLMPQKWQEHWRLLDGSKGLTPDERWTTDASDPRHEASVERDRLVQSIGNLTLLTHQLNSSISNGSWAKKRVKIAEHSVLPLNQKVVVKEGWDEDGIKARAKALAKSALRIWPGPIPAV